MSNQDKPRDVMIGDRHFKEAAVVRNRWSVVLTPEQAKPDLSEPRFWSNIARRLSNGDIIEVRTENETAYGEFIVVESSNIHAKVQELSWHELGARDKSVQDAEYKYKWRGPIHRHCVVRISDDHCMVENLPSKESCLEWIRTHRAQAA